MRVRDDRVVRDLAIRKAREWVMMKVVVVNCEAPGRLAFVA